MKEKIQNENGIILISGYNDKGIFDEYKEEEYQNMQVGDEIQFYENGIPTETFTVLAKAATADMETGGLLGAGSNLSGDISTPIMYMSEKHFKEITKIRLSIVFCLIRKKSSNKIWKLIYQSTQPRKIWMFSTSQ